MDVSFPVNEEFTTAGIAQNIYTYVNQITLSGVPTPVIPVLPQTSTQEPKPTPTQEQTAMPTSNEPPGSASGTGSATQPGDAGLEETMSPNGPDQSSSGPGGPSGQGGPGGPGVDMSNYPIIGLPPDLSNAHVQRLKDRVGASNSVPFIYLSLSVFYVFYTMFTFLSYYVRTAPNRRGFNYRKIKLLFIQTIVNAVAGVLIFVRCSYAELPELIIIIYSFAGLIPWAFCVLLRASQLLYAIKLNEAQVSCYSVIKASTTGVTAGSGEYYNNGSKSWINPEDSLNLGNAVAFYQLKLKKLSKMKKYFTENFMVLIYFGFQILMVGVVVLISLLNKDDITADEHGWGATKNPITITFILLFGIMVLFGFPLLAYSIKKCHESYNLRIEMICSAIVTVFATALFFIWNALSASTQKSLSAWTWYFVVLLASHTAAICYPLYKLNNYSVAYTKDDFDDQNTRRTTRSTSKNFRPSFTGVGADRRREFLALLDSPSLYRQLKQCAADYLCSELVLFLDEYQTLKKRVLEYFESNTDIQNSYKGELHPDDFMDRNSVLSRKNVHTQSTSGTYSNKTRSYLENPVNNQLNANTDSVQLSTKSEKNSDMHGTASGFPSVVLERFLSNAPVSLTICGSLEYLFPSANIYSTTPAPRELHQLFKSFCSVFIDPNSDLVVNIHGSIIDEIIQQISDGEITLGVFDDAREEILDMLYFGVFPRYLDLKNKKPMKKRWFDFNLGWFRRKQLKI
ncbi:hypothetical protein AX774_g346 [Zancudomyces culisetae]|uniref:RGS domain-containing protein n=1 Tax=Zancudomyces culisetae TaxID=1213189 RepID=A0A1R1PYU3_ZANCU|nr:hypothetical protein AX774_g346 [Zancudomyces culisetae]|eukprot:OMH86115.1 hypothetical protein AX774_g346 [Zancudomyces culisetae]